MDGALKLIATEVSNFEDLVTQDFLYVDKTRVIYDLLVTHRNLKYCFIARPRRFGKSLTVSTLEHVFKGHKDLFAGTYIEGRYDFPQHSVIRLDMNRFSTSSVDSFKEDLLDWLTFQAKAYDVQDEVCNGAREPSSYLSRLISSIKRKTGVRVVVLVDEYDSLLVEHVDDRFFNDARMFLASFYEVLKVCEPELRFVFITGVTRFTHVSLFSKLNNLRDLSESPDFVDLCGYTDEEVDKWFGPYLKAHCAIAGLDEDGEAAIRQRMKQYYDGYRFSLASPVTMYNPVSIGRFFSEGCVFKNYWLETGNQSLVNAIIKADAKAFLDGPPFRIQPEDALVFEAGDLFGKGRDVSFTYSYLLQAGYLTRECIDNRGYLVLSYPNEEVAVSMSIQVLRTLRYKVTTTMFDEIAEALDKEDTAAMMAAFSFAFEQFPYETSVVKERSFQFLMFFILQALSKDARLEEHVLDGRADITARVHDDVYYIIELKLDKTPEEALEQIIERGYAKKYMKPGNRLHLLGVNFSSQQRNIDGWKEEVLLP